MNRNFPHFRKAKHQTLFQPKIDKIYLIENEMIRTNGISHYKVTYLNCEKKYVVIENEKLFQ